MGCRLPNAWMIAPRLRCVTAQAGSQPEDRKRISGIPSASIFEGAYMWQEISAVTMGCRLPNAWMITPRVRCMTAQAGPRMADWKRNQGRLQTQQ
eukprot:11176448-Alexandrium_andersonii.AAC.1